MSLWNSTDTQASKPKFLGLGQLRVINFTGTGTGYTSGSFTIGAPPAGGVQAVATYVAAAGTITSVTITNPGAGYVTAPTVTTGAGTGLTLTAVITAPKKTTGPNSNIVFVDATEAALAQNRAKGIKIPGWIKYAESVDNQGNNRYRVETLIAMGTTQASAGDNNLDDVIASDAAFAIQTQPSNATSVTGGATFTTAATGATGFQWQVRRVSGGQYVNATGTIDGITYTNGTTATLTLAGITSPNTGTRVRCQIINTTSGSANTTTAATLTFGT